MSGNQTNTPSSTTFQKTTVEILSAKAKTAQDIKIYVIPYFLKIYEELFAELDSIKYNEKPKTSTNQNATAVSTTPSGNEQNGGASSYSEFQIKEMIDFVYRILVDLNMYANPEYLDWLYHYARLLGMNIFENFDLSKYAPEKLPVAKGPVGNRIHMDIYKVGKDKKSEQDIYESSIKTESYGVSSLDRVDNLFTYVFNAKKPFQQKYIRLPIFDQDMGLTKDPANPNVLVAKTTDANNTSAEGIPEKSGSNLNPSQISDNGSKDKKAQENSNGLDKNKNNTSADAKGGKNEDKYAETYEKAGGGKVETYRYLDDFILARNFEDGVEETVVKCKVHLCIFSLDRSCVFESTEPTPFLKFLVKPKDTTVEKRMYGFVQFDYDVPNENATEDFKCRLYNELFSAIDLYIHGGSEQTCDTMSESLNSIYKGIKCEEVNGEHHVFAFFDYDAILARAVQDGPLVLDPHVVAAAKVAVVEAFAKEAVDKLKEEFQPTEEDAVLGGSTDALLVIGLPKISDNNLSTPFRWGIVDELVVEQNICGVHDVDPTIQAAFVKNDLLWNIKKGPYNKIIDFPFSVYATTIKETADGAERFDNIHVPVDEESAKLREESIIDLPQIDVYGREDEYGERYCFTYEPFVSQILPQRYAVFTTNAEYLVEDKDFDVFDLEQEAKQEQVPAVEEETKQEQVPAEDDEPKQEQVSTEEVDEAMITKLETPVIYFIANNEYTGNKPVIMWGIKDRNRFVGL